LVGTSSLDIKSITRQMQLRMAAVRTAHQSELFGLVMLASNLN
jgi:hypothetical protein